MQPRKAEPLHLPPLVSEPEPDPPPGEDDDEDPETEYRLPPLPASQMGGTLGALMTAFRQAFPDPAPNSGEDNFEDLKKCR